MGNNEGKKCYGNNCFICEKCLDYIYKENIDTITNKNHDILMQNVQTLVNEEDEMSTLLAGVLLAGSVFE